MPVQISADRPKPTMMPREGLRASWLRDVSDVARGRRRDGLAGSAVADMACSPIELRLIMGARG